MAKRRFGIVFRKHGSVMPPVSDVNVMNVKGKIEHRETKHCVCIYSSEDEDIYLLINTKSPKTGLGKVYDDFQLKSVDYEFLNETDRYVNCSSVHKLEKERILEKKGNLNYEDMMTILNKMRNSTRITRAEKNVIVPELEKWLKNGDYSINKLSTVFKYR